MPRKIKSSKYKKRAAKTFTRKYKNFKGGSAPLPTPLGGADAETTYQVTIKQISSSTPVLPSINTDEKYNANIAKLKTFILNIYKENPNNEEYVTTKFNEYFNLTRDPEKVLFNDKNDLKSNILNFMLTVHEGESFARLENTLEGRDHKFTAFLNEMFP